MATISIQDRFAPLAAKLSALDSNATFFQKLEHKIFSAQRIAQKRSELNRRVVARMIPAIRSALSAAYANSGLETETGKLRTASVGAEIKAIDHGISIQIVDASVEKQAAALQFGAIHTKGKTGKTVRKEYDFFNIDALDVEAIYLKFYQEEVNAEMAQ